MTMGSDPQSHLQYQWDNARPDLLIKIAELQEEILRLKAEGMFNSLNISQLNDRLRTIEMRFPDILDFECRHGVKMDAACEECGAGAITGFKR